MKLLIVGAGGYGGTNLKALFANAYPNEVIEGVVDPFIEGCAYKEQIRAAGIPVYDTMEEFYREHSADLAVISTPTFLHCEQSIAALENGSYVLCEKPAAPTCEQVEKMIEAEKKYGRFLAIGFQWSFSDAIQALKRDALDGKLGKPVLLRTMIQWPRNRAYYARGGGWGGCIQRGGVPVNDSIAANACAHYLHNMLFVLGGSMEESAMPDHTEAECLRANAIENFDTCAIRMHFDATGADALFVASHATEITRNPEFVYTFTDAEVTYSRDEGSQIVAHFKDGTTKNYGDPFCETHGVKKLSDCIACVENGTRPVCSVSTAYPHASVIDRLQQHIDIVDFPQVCENREENRVYVEGLSETMKRVYEHASSFAQEGYDFARKVSF